MNFPDGYERRLTTRSRLAKQKPEHADEIRSSFGWFSGSDMAVYHFLGPWLVAYPCIDIHEVTHAVHHFHDWPVVDCPCQDCVMAEAPEYLAILKHRIETGKWHCRECWFRAHNPAPWGDW